MCGAGGYIVHVFGHTELVSTGPVRKLWHLAARFFTSLSTKPPSDETEAWVAERLLPGEQRLWVQLSNQDRRHSALVGQRFAAMDPAAPA